MKKIKLITVALALTTSLLVLGGCGSSTPAAGDKTTGEVKVFQGVGQTSNFRDTGRKTDSGVLKYNINYVTAAALFDNEGKIIDVQFDVLEISNPNEAEEGAVIFSGWPTQPGYAGSASNTVETATEEVANWKTKRERGDEAYGMNWSEQFNLFQETFKGMTVAEVEQWFAKNTSDLNGKPLMADSEKAEDQAKYAKLTEDEKAALADVTSGASISLKDGHGDFIGALVEAFENKKEVTIPAAK